MKKITAFFMAILPFFVTILLFISGLIVKDSTHVYVESVSMPEKSIQIKKEVDGVEPTEELPAVALPKNANNPGLDYSSENEDVATYGNGVVTAKGYGTTYVKAQSQENPEKKATCKVEVWDDKVHEILVDNRTKVEQIPYYSTVKMDISTVPSTHITKDPLFKYEVTWDKTKGDCPISVSPDGEITAEEPSNLENNTAKITIKSESFPNAKPAVVDVKVSGGVQYIECKDPTNLVTSEKTYDLKSQLLTFPDAISTLADSELVFSSSDESVAKIDAKGVVTFTKPGAITATVSYLRNPDVKIEKQIVSTSNQFLDVSFNTYSYTADVSDFTDNPVIKQDQIGWNVFPDGSNQDAVTITSSNTNVIEVQKENNKPKLIARNAGITVLTASIKVGETTKSDTCFVTLTKAPTGSESIFKAGLTEDNPVIIDSYYYDLRNNIDQSKIYQSTYDKTKWGVLTTSISYLDKDNELLHFTKDNEVNKVSLEVNSKIYSFYIKAKTQTPTTLGLETAKVKVGKLYSLADGYTPVDSAQWNTFFDMIGTNQLVPKKGGTISLDITNGTDTKTLAFAIAEDPIVISLSNLINKKYTTAAKEVKLADTVVPNLIPASAADEDGNLYKDNIKYKYTIDESIGSYDEEEDKLIFVAPGAASVTISLDNGYTDTISIESTYGNAGKFELTDKATSTKIKSGVTFNVDPGTVKELSLTSLLPGLSLGDAYSYFNIESVSQSKICEIEKLPIGTSPTSIDFKITVDEYAVGQEVLCITNGTFNFYITIVISKPKLQDFYLLYRGEYLNKYTSNTTFTKNLVLNVTMSPIMLADASKFTATWNGTTTIEHGNTFKLDLSTIPADQWKETDNTLTLTYVDDPTISRTYYFDYKSTIQDFSISEADDSNTINLKSTTVKKVCTISLGGLADKSVYDKFSAKISDGYLGKASVDEGTKNKVVITDITDPSINVEYESKLELSYDDKVTKTYDIKRDIVSNIVLPNHDMYDENNARGLQKIRVFGNESFYTPEEGKIDYYKLPITLYKYDNTEFTGADKENAFNTLKTYITDGCSFKYHKADKFNKEDFLEIHFNNKALYSVEEIYNNAFDTLLGKNVFFNIHSNSYAAYQSYTFVPVKGVNAYEQTIFKKAESCAIVLQSNFGLPEGSSENMPFNNEWFDFRNIYGNGYTLSFDDHNQKYLDKKITKSDVTTTSVLNTNILGANAAKNRDQYQIWLLNKPQWIIENDQRASFNAYSYFSHLKSGLDCKVGTANQKIKLFYTKNCMFYENQKYSYHLNSSGDKFDSTGYIQDCVFFNCSSFSLETDKHASLYLKGFIDVYNFEGKNILDPYGPAIALLWPILLSMAYSKNMVQIDAKGAETINSGLANLMGNNYQFYNGVDKEGKDIYVDQETIEPGNHPLAAQYMNFLGGLSGTLAIWSTRIPSIEQGAPSYYDEYDNDGVIRLDFFAKQTKKVVRTPIIL